ncbi:MAG: hypothetical protein HDR88_08060 [Bacteroides sp.]|nr:hypothetical protein [Bacteroides sp.]
MKWIRTLIIAAALVAVGCIVWWCTRTPENVSYKTQSAKVKAISNMVELCTTDIHEEIPIKDSINGKWIVARQVVEGRIRFDIERLKTETQGDTLIVYLPRERVDILENASPNAYQVLDTWDGKSMMFPRTLTAAEENAVKKRWQNRIRKKLYARGYVKRARHEAVNTLIPLITAMQAPGTTVMIIDPTPAGSFY